MEQGGDPAAGAIAEPEDLVPSVTWELLDRIPAVRPGVGMRQGFARQVCCSIEPLPGPGTQST
jgi:hypothetical protein